MYKFRLFINTLKIRRITKPSKKFPYLVSVSGYKEFPKLVYFRFAPYNLTVTRQLLKRVVPGSVRRGYAATLIDCGTYSFVVFAFKLF